MTTGTNEESIFTEEKVLTAITVFCTMPGDNTRFKEAERFLVQFEKSKEAWEISYNLLSQESHESRVSIDVSY
jgi:hypothetical protein